MRSPRTITVTLSLLLIPAVVFLWIKVEQVRADRVANTESIIANAGEIEEIVESLKGTKPADVKAHVLQLEKMFAVAIEEFHDSRFTKADGDRLKRRIDQLVEVNQLKE